jgi:hypothetical protein
MAVSPTVRNAIGTAAVYLSFMLLLFVSPDPSKKEAELLCEGAGVTTAVFPDMATCIKDARFKQAKCSCYRPRSEWARWYAFSVVPVIATFVGYILLRGSFRWRLLLLNAAVASAIITETVRAVLSDPAAGMGVPLVPLLLIGFCLGSSLFFAFLYYGQLAYERKRGVAT